MLIERLHINLWYFEPMPVLLIVYDASAEQAYWMYVQRHLQASGATLRSGQLELTLRLPTQNIVNNAAVEGWRQFKANVLRHIEEGTRLHE